MRKVLVLIIMMLLIFPVSGIRHEVYSKAKPSDEGLYTYFSEIIKKSEKILDYFLKEDPNSLNLSISLLNEIKTIEEENRFYSAMGVKTNVSLLIDPFVKLGNGNRMLSQNQMIFLNNIKYLLKNRENYSAYFKAKEALANIKLAAYEINNSINLIEGIELWNESSILRFDVSGMRSKLKDVYDLIEYYEDLISGFEEKSLVVVVSNRKPFLYQEVTIYVYAKNITGISLFIDDARFRLKDVDVNVKVYSFKKLGEHVIYAEGFSNGSLLRSNVVKVYVSKIPTYITLVSKPIAFLNERVEIKGFLSDYFNNPLDGDLFIRINDSDSFKLRSNNGFFNFSVTNSVEGNLKIYAFYPGSEIYRSSSSTVFVFFSRFPLHIYLRADKTRIEVNESVNFTCSFYGIRKPISVHVFLDGKELDVFNDLTGELNFTIKFPESGKHSVFVYFPGDEIHRSARSNVVDIIVGKGLPLIKPSVIGQRFIGVYFGNPIYYIILILITALVITVTIHVRGLKVFRQRVETEYKEEEKKEEVKEKSVEIELPESISDAYKILFDKIVDKYGLKRSLTPRELLNEMRKEIFADKLDFITSVHEKVVYGCKELDKDEKEMYFRSIAEVLKVIV